MMTECYLVAAQLLCFTVKVAPPHSGTYIAGAFFYRIHCAEYVAFKYCNGNSQSLSIAFDQFPVRFVVARIHNKKGQFKFLLSVALDLLKQFGHEHGILTA